MVNIMKYDSSGRLFGNFMQYEVAKSSTAARLGIDNTPPEEVLAAARHHSAQILQPIRDHYGVPFSPQSWYRSEKLEHILTLKSFKKWCNNRALNHTQSESWAVYFARKSHPKGEATDIEIPGISNDVLFDWCEANLDYDQLIREFGRPGEPTSGWVHISSKLTGNRQQTFRI